MSEQEKQYADDVDRLIAINTEINELKDRLKELNKLRGEVEGQILESWVELGKNRESRRGVTIYKANELQCSGQAGKSEELAIRLSSAGFADFVRESISWPTLKSWIREVSPTDETTGRRDFSAVPAEILELLNVYERSTLRIVKG